jgi:hypothetical protein
MIAPKRPNNPKLRINKPAGILVTPLSSEPLNTGNSTGAGGVKVGKRVGVCPPRKTSSSIGSIVGVEFGVGVGGIEISGRNAPGERPT